MGERPSYRLHGLTWLAILLMGWTMLQIQSFGHPIGRGWPVFIWYRANRTHTYVGTHRAPILLLASVNVMSSLSCCASLAFVVESLVRRRRRWTFSIRFIFLLCMLSAILLALYRGPEYRMLASDRLHFGSHHLDFVHVIPFTLVPLYLRLGGIAGIGCAIYTAACVTMYLFGRLHMFAIDAMQKPRLGR